MKKAPLSVDAMVKLQAIEWKPAKTMGPIGALLLLFSLFQFLDATPIFTSEVPDFDFDFDAHQALGYLWLGAGVILLALAVVGDHMKMKADRQKVNNENEIDYRQSLALKELLHRFASMPLTNLPPPPQTLGQGWKPFRVEHFWTSTTRGGIKGHVDLYDHLLFFGPEHARITGTTLGSAIPDLFDDSCVLFLTSEQRTLRVLIPSPRVTRHLLAQTLEQWLGHIQYSTHCSEVLHQFAMQDHDALFAGSTPLSVIDELDATCSLPLEQRPTVGVCGELLQPGVALVTSLEHEGRPRVIFSSGRFNALRNTIAQTLPASSPAILPHFSVPELKAP